MTAHERLDRIQRIWDLAFGKERGQTVSLALNERVVHPPPEASIRDQMSMAAQGMAAQNARGLNGYEPPPPPPTGRWIASIGREWADHDDPEVAVKRLEIKVVAEATRYAHDRQTDLRKRLDDAEELARKIQEASE